MGASSIFACTTCGAPAMALKPGSKPMSEAGILLSRGEAPESWCLKHWLHRFGPAQPDLFEASERA